MLTNADAGIDQGPLLVPLNGPSEGRPTLVCFPHVGGGPAAYRHWARASAELCICAIQLPGREARLREEPFRDLGLAAEAAAAAISAKTSGSLALFGHSMGALLSFEVARRLAPTRSLSHLFVASYPAPQLRKTRPAVSEISDAELIEALRAQGGGGAQIWDDPEAASIFLPTIRADYGMLERYSYKDGPPLCCPITVMGGIADPVVPPADLRPWAEQTSSTATVRLAPGGHFFLNEGQDLVLDAIQGELIGP